MNNHANETVNSVESSTNELSTRIKAVIELYPSRKSAAKAAGVSADMLARYMRGESQPSFSVVSNLCMEVGASLEWVATGAGNFKKSYSAENIETSSLSIPRLVAAIETVDQGLSETGTMMPADKKAQLIMSVYELFHDHTDYHEDKGKVLRLIRSIT